MYKLKLSAFRSNSVTHHKFILRPPDRNAFTIQVSLSVHLSENGANSFDAPESNIVNDEYEIIHTNQVAL